MSWALLCWADPAQPLRVFSTHSFLESYLWITTKLPPASLERAEKAHTGRLLSRLGGMVWPFPDPFPGSAPWAHQEIPVPAPCPGSNEPTLLPERLLTHRGWDFCAQQQGWAWGGGEKSHNPWLEALLTLQETPGLQSQMSSWIIKYPNWKGPTGIIQAKCWPCTGHPHNPSPGSERFPNTP